MRNLFIVAALVATTAVCGAFSATASAAGPGCSSATTGGTVTRSLAGRSYQLHVPSGLSGNVPLLLSFHGAGSTGQQDELFTGWSGFADARKFIVAYPQARPFDFGGVWDPYTADSADVPFARQVVDDIAATYCVDPHRVYADGWSNGAVMSQRIACAAADKFAAVTSYGGGTPTLAGFATGCHPSRPIAVGLFAGQFDFTYAGLGQNTSEWRAVDACSGNPAHSADQYGSQDTYTCAGGSQVLSRVVSNTSHNWPFAAQAEDQRSRMWAFFGANPLP
jgi:polyhydroxybutyrate depolymerase